jgi:hypothetical protein
MLARKRNEREQQVEHDFFLIPAYAEKDEISDICK